MIPVYLLFFLEVCAHSPHEFQIQRGLYYFEDILTILVLDTEINFIQWQMIHRFALKFAW